jgi:hypothetical protein
MSTSRRVDSGATPSVANYGLHQELSTGLAMCAQDAERTTRGSAWVLPHGLSAGPWMDVNYAMCVENKEGRVDDARAKGKGPTSVSTKRLTDQEAWLRARLGGDTSMQ